jgi:hypothetical protein
MLDNRLRWAYAAAILFSEQPDTTHFVPANIFLIMNVLVLNPGGNSLKVEVVECAAAEAAYAGRKLASVILEGIGKEPCLSVQDGKRVV